VISLPAALGLRLRHEERVASTNGLLIEEATLGAAAGLVVLADLQTHGRGRQGRVWLSSAGTGLMFSLLRRPPVEAAESVRWTLLAGVAVVTALRAQFPGAWLKWPNDILVGDRKLGGILCERSQGDDGLGDALVIGIGVNLRSPPGGWPRELQGKATSIHEEIGSQVPGALRRGALLVAILEHFVAFEAELLEAGPGALMKQYRDFMAPLLGRQVRVQRSGQEQTVRVLGVADSGSLEVVDDEGATWAVMAGDVHLGSL